VKLTSGCILASSAICRCFVDTSVDSIASSVCPTDSSTIRRLPSLHGVLVGSVPPLHRYCEGATTSRCPFCLASFPSLGNTIYRLRPCSSLPVGFRTLLPMGQGFLSSVTLLRFPKAWRQRDLPSSWATLIRICPVLRPRRDLHVRPVRRFGSVPA
jgi:hypothetical protein